MSESSDTSDTPAKPQDYASLRAELAKLVSDFAPIITDLWPRLEDHEYWWELRTYGLPEGYDKLVVSDTHRATQERGPGYDALPLLARTRWGRAYLQR